MSKSSGRLTSAEVLKRTNLTSTKTLTRWHQKDLISAPIVLTHPSGRGKTAYFDERVVPRIIRIRELVAKGYGLYAAAAEVDRQDLEHAVTDTIKLRDGSERRRGDLFIAFVLQLVEPLIPLDSAPGQALISQLQQSNIYEAALQLAQQGINPVLVLDGRSHRVVPDFVLRTRVNMGKWTPFGRVPLIVVPLALPLEEADAAVGERRAFDYDTFAVDRVVEMKGGKRRERNIEVIPADPWGWKFSDRDSKPVKSKAAGRDRRTRTGRGPG